MHGVFILGFELQVAVFFVQECPTFPDSGNPLTDGMNHLNQFVLIGCVDSLESGFTLAICCIDLVQEQHVKYTIILRVSMSIVLLHIPLIECLY